MVKAGRYGGVQGDSTQNCSSCAASVYRTAECSEYFQAANLCKKKKKKNALLIAALSTFYDVYFHRTQHQKLT